MLTPQEFNRLTDPISLIAVLLIFLLAGVVKGVIGLGLPTISLALMSLLFELPTAMAIMVVPSLITNLWQGLSGSGTLMIVRRVWPFLLVATLSIWIGARLLTRTDPAVLTAILGAVLVLYALVGLMGYRVSIGEPHRLWSGLACGLINGTLGGMTGTFVVPGVLYLQAIGLPRDQLIHAMGLLFGLSSIALTVALQRNGLLNATIVSTSAIAVLPALAGLWLGERQIRHRLPEKRFRFVFFLALLVLGGGLALRSVSSLM